MLIIKSMDYHNSWKNFIEKSVYLNDMIKFVSDTPNICPEKENVFRFFNCNLTKTKYIILGMDPYYSTFEKDGKILPVATGRAFEVMNIDKWTDRYRQVSLSTIFKSLCYYKFNINYNIDELRQLENKGEIKYINTHDWFDTMEDRGVIFLNSTLTSVVGKSGAHISKWTNFINELIMFINENSDCSWLIWGNNALDRVKDIINSEKIIYSCHPASRTNNDFIINNCFKKAKGVDWF